MQNNPFFGHVTPKSVTLKKLTCVDTQTRGTDIWTGVWDDQMTLHWQMERVSLLYHIWHEKRFSLKILFNVKNTLYCIILDNMENVL